MQEFAGNSDKTIRLFFEAEFGEDGAVMGFTLGIPVPSTMTEKEMEDGKKKFMEKYTDPSVVMKELLGVEVKNAKYVSEEYYEGEYNNDQD